MFQRILVPLDGSARAEQALPIAARVARATGGTVVLLHVVVPRHGYAPYLTQAPSFINEILQKAVEQARSYLTNVAESEVMKGIRTEIQVIAGLPAQNISTFAGAIKIDLIMMCSHGYTGFKRWALGSIAQQVVRHSAIPVLLLREGSPQPATSLADSSHTLRVAVALDGSSLAERVLVPTAHLVAALSAPQKGELHLISVIKPAEKLHYTEDDAIEQDQAVQAASAYLRMLSDELHVALTAELGVHITTSVMVGEDVADALIREAELGEDTATFQACDALALATHGHNGLHRWMVGSVTERVLDGSHLPLLIIRPQMQQVQPPKKALAKAAIS